MQGGQEGWDLARRRKSVNGDEEWTFKHACKHELKRMGSSFGNIRVTEYGVPIVNGCNQNKRRISFCVDIYHPRQRSSDPCLSNVMEYYYGHLHAERPDRLPNVANRTMILSQEAVYQCKSSCLEAKRERPNRLHYPSELTDSLKQQARDRPGDDVSPIMAWPIPFKTDCTLSHNHENKMSTNCRGTLDA